MNLIIQNKKGFLRPPLKNFNVLAYTSSSSLELNSEHFSFSSFVCSTSRSPVSFLSTTTNKLKICACKISPSSSSSIFVSVIMNCSRLVQPHPYSEHLMCIFNRWAPQGPLDFNRYSLQRMVEDLSNIIMVTISLLPTRGKSTKRWILGRSKKQSKSGSRRATGEPKKRKIIRIWWPRWWLGQKKSLSDSMGTRGL